MAINADWLKIQNEYITTEISQRDIAKKYGISWNTLSKRANREEWARKRKEYYDKSAKRSQQILVEKNAEQSVSRIEGILKIADTISPKIEKAVSQLELMLIEGEVIDTNFVDTYRLRQVVKSLKDLKEIVSGDIAEVGSQDKQQDLINVIKQAVQGNEN